MDRAERASFAAALAVQAGLLWLLSTRLAAPPPPVVVPPPTMEVSLAKNVALQQSSPAPTPPSASEAPEEGPPEDAAPPPQETAPPQPEPTAAPPPPPKPAPAPKPAPEKPAPKPAPAPKPEPKPTPKPEPKPSPAPKPSPKPAAKPAPAPEKPAPTKPAPAKPAPPTRPAKPAATPGKSTGSTEGAKADRPRGSHLGADFLKGLTETPTKAPPSAAAPGATMSAAAAADIGSAILRQVQPCANRQVTPGPGAERIRVAVNLKLNRDGSLASRPVVVGHTGVDDDNQRYVGRVDDLAIATFTGCSPLRDLPEALYDVPHGWRNFTLRYKLPG